MVESPRDEGPVAAVPQSAEQEDGKGVETFADCTFAVAAQGNIDVVFEPAHQGDVPPAPEVLHGGGKVGAVEVAGDVDAEETGRTHRHVAVAREVAVNLEGEVECAKPECGQADGVVVAEDVIDLGSTVVGDKHFLDKPPEDEPHAFGGFCFGEGASHLDLWKEARPSLDGTGNKLGEECDEGEEMKEGEGWRGGLLFIYINDVS